MIILPCIAIAMLVYHTYRATLDARVRSERAALHVSAVRAIDREQWSSLDY